MIRNGSKSVQINSLKNILNNTTFKDKTSFEREYYIQKEGKKYINFAIMPVMDLDDADEETIKSYVSGEMFKDHWLREYIVPIWNRTNLDKVMLDLQYISRLPDDKEKGELYTKLFPVCNGKGNVSEIKKMKNKIKLYNNSNMDKLISYCLDCMEE